ncbi:hypothetical protein N9L68_08480 [bacterium]|nr:hypothetical protein [bacterium]
MAIFSWVWKDTLLAIIHHAIAQGKTPEDPEWPLAHLAHWGRYSAASSVAGEADLRIFGLVDIRLELRVTDGSGALHVFRFLRGGLENPLFLLVGAPAIDSPPLGIGHRPLLHGHIVPGLGVQSRGRRRTPCRATF